MKVWCRVELYRGKASCKVFLRMRRCSVHDVSCSFGGTLMLEADYLKPQGLCATSAGRPAGRQEASKWASKQSSLPGMKYQLKYHLKYRLKYRLNGPA